MRQTGFMAASAAYALTHNFLLLPGVHDLTRKLESGLQEIGVEITSAAETCMVCGRASHSFTSESTYTSAGQHLAN